MNNKFSNGFFVFCKTGIGFFSVLIIGFLFCLSLFNTSTISFDYTETTYFVKDSVIRNIVILAVFLILLVFLYKNRFTNKIFKKIESDNKVFNILKYSLLGLIVVSSCLWIFTAQLYPEADQYSVQLTAAELLKQDFSGLENGAYVYRYPFQAGIVELSYLMALIIGPQNYLVLEVINAIAMAIIFKELSEIGREFGLNRILQLGVIASAVIYPVFILYTYFIYGTFIGLALILICIKYTIMYYKENNKKYLFVILFTSMFAMIAKSNYDIFVIALIITTVLYMIRSKNISSILLVVVFCVSILVQAKLPLKIMESATGHELDSGISYASYIAMGFQEGERAPGWYNGYNNDSYAEAGNDSEVQTVIAMKEVRNRLECFAENPKYAFEFFTKKAASSWNNPTYQALWNLDGKISNEYTRTSWAMKVMDQMSIYTLQKYLNIMHLIILFGSLLYILVPRKGSGFEYGVIFELCIIGGFIFHLVWEAKSQYMINYFSLLIPLAISGYYQTIRFIFAKERKIDLKVLLPKVMIVVLVLMLFVTGKTSFLDTDNQKYYNYVYNIEEY